MAIIVDLVDHFVEHGCNWKLIKDFCLDLHGE